MEDLLPLTASSLVASLPSAAAALDAGLDQLLDAALDPALDLGLERGLDAVLLDPTSSTNALVFVLIAALGLLMALIYVPLRLYLTLTARSRRLRLLQRIRRLREELSDGLAPAAPAPSPPEMASPPLGEAVIEPPLV